MALTLKIAEGMLTTEPTLAWQTIMQHALEICRQTLKPDNAANEIQKRDRELSSLDLLLSSGAWDLWTAYESAVPKTVDALTKFWDAHQQGRAILVLDALSLRELPWLLQEAERRGYAIQEVAATGAELPPDTNAFARALGFAQRSALENNGAGKAHKLKGARTECTGLPFKDCAAIIDSSPSWILWHHWFDDRLHVLGSPGPGVSQLTTEASLQLVSDDFWALVDRLSTGRRLVITSDHGYAASGLFPDTPDTSQGDYLRTRFRSGRNAPQPSVEPQPWVPPLDLVLNTAYGEHAFALGRRKWKSQGGYPTLTHGGLSVLEIAVPYVELSRPR